MDIRRLRLMALCSAPLIGACVAEDPGGPAGPAVEIQVAPLTLPGVQGVEYALAVFNVAPTPAGLFNVDGVVQNNVANLVWQQGSVTSNQYGNGPGGAISYVGPCDASADDNWVAVALKKVDVGNLGGSYDVATGAFSGGSDNLLDDQKSAVTATPGSNDLDPDFVNPSPYDLPYVLKFACEENKDTEVVFNLTIMRDAEQGFFDVAVNFEDIFCSMKVDTCYDQGRRIKLLFDEEGNRVETAVLAAACSAGTDDNDTIMWMAPLEVSCAGDVSFTIDPTGDHDDNPATPGRPGNHCTDVVLAAGSGGLSATTAHGTLTLIAGEIMQNNGDGGIPQGTTCHVLLGIAPNQTLGPAFTLDEAATAAKLTVDVTASAPGATGNQQHSGDVVCVIDSNYKLYNESTLTLIGGANATTGTNAVTAEVCYALYWGEEDLQCEGDGCNKEYWNVAIDIDRLRDLGLEDCNVTTAVTASSSTDALPFVAGALPGPGQSYGFVAFDAPLTDETGAPTCLQGPMGSEYAAIEYGTSDDVLGGQPFPELCTRFTQGDRAPVELLSVAGYFADRNQTLADALYGGSIAVNRNAAGQIVSYRDARLRFVRMGAPIGGACGSNVRNRKEVIYFDAEWQAGGGEGRQNLAWRGLGGGRRLAGRYRVQAWRRNTKVEAWQKLNDTEIVMDFSNIDHLKAFARGTTFASSGYDSFAIELTRDDDGPAEELEIEFGFAGSFPDFMYAVCSVSTNACTCFESNGTLSGLSSEACFAAVDITDVYLVP